MSTDISTIPRPVKPLSEEGALVERPVTVIGFWKNDKIAIAGVVDGERDVWGGDDELSDEGLFAASFMLDANDPEPEATLHRLIAEEYYDDEDEG